MSERTYEPVYPQAGTMVEVAAQGEKRKRTSFYIRISDLIAADLLPAGTLLRPVQPAYTIEAVVLPDGKIAFDDEIYGSPSAVSDIVSGGSTNGWTFWTADTADGRVTLAALRERYFAEHE